MDRPNRRQFITAAAVTFALAMCLLPALGDPPAKPDHKGVDIGPLTDYKGKPDSISIKWWDNGVFLVQSSGKLYGLSAYCPPHYDVITLDKDHNQFVCAKNGSTFAADGALVKGPAPKGMRYVGITLEHDGHIKIWPGHWFDHDKFGVHGSFIKTD